MFTQNSLVLRHFAVSNLPILKATFDDKIVDQNKCLQYGICSGRFVLRCQSGFDEITFTVEALSGAVLWLLTSDIRESVSGFVPPFACCGETLFTSNAVLGHCWTCHVRTRWEVSPKRSNFSGDYLRGRLALVTAAKSDQREVCVLIHDHEPPTPCTLHVCHGDRKTFFSSDVLHPSGYVPVAPPAASSSQHTSTPSASQPRADIDRGQQSQDGPNPRAD